MYRYVWQFSSIQLCMYCRTGPTYGTYNRNFRVYSLVFCYHHKRKILSILVSSVFKSLWRFNKFQPQLVWELLKTFVLIIQHILWLDLEKKRYNFILKIISNQWDWDSNQCLICERSIFQTFWKAYCCTKSFFF